MSKRFFRIIQNPKVGPTKFLTTKISKNSVRNVRVKLESLNLYLFTKRKGDLPHQRFVLTETPLIKEKELHIYIRDDDVSHFTFLN